MYEACYLSTRPSLAQCACAPSHLVTHGVSLRLLRKLDAVKRSPIHGSKKESKKDPKMAALIRTLYFLYSHPDNRRGAEPQTHLHPRDVDYPPGAPRPPPYDTITGSTKAGFIALGVCGLVSLLATSTLFLFLTYRFLFSSRHYAWPLWRNQYVVLIYNLLLVDMQQATAFMLCLYWSVKERIWYPSAACCWLSPVHENERLWGHYIWIFLSEFGTIILYSTLTIYLRRRMKQAARKIQMHNYNRSPRESQALKRLNRVVIYMLVYPLSYVVLSLPLAAGRMSTARHVIPSREYFAVAGSLMALSGAFDTIVYTLTRRQLLLHTEGGSSGVLTGTGAGQGGRIYAYSQDHTFRTHISAKGRDSSEQDENGNGGQSDGGRNMERGKARWIGCAGRKSLRRGRLTLTNPARDGREGSMEQIVKNGNDRDSNRDRNMEMKEMDSEVSGGVSGVYQETTFEITHEEVDGDYQRSYQHRQ
ncbi:uncharacterized protein BDW70DRAFT_149377 [Aspergillus foveolatus]|uniref:uncharacterized protein n=1 Tax=Aspergillus foveolatus TaxID=210207 RepID=UPI003CCCA714